MKPGKQLFPFPAYGLNLKIYTDCFLPENQTPVSTITPSADSSSWHVSVCGNRQLSTQLLMNKNTNLEVVSLPTFPVRLSPVLTSECWCSRCRLWGRTCRCRCSRRSHSPRTWTVPRPWSDESWRRWRSQRRLCCRQRWSDHQDSSRCWCFLLKNIWDC